MPPGTSEDLVVAYQRACRAWVRWAMTPAWRRRARRRRRARTELLADRADAIRAAMGADPEAGPLITVLDRVGPRKL